MRTYEQFLTEYGHSHQNPVNTIIHLFCVPIIFFSTAGLGWCVSLGQFIPGLSPEVASWVNLTTLAAIPVTLFYAKLGRSSLLTGLAWMAISVALCVAIQNAGLPLLWISAVLWMLAWVVQFVGHHIEGAKPSFSDDLVFLLIGPLFVQKKFERLLGSDSR